MSSPEYEGSSYFSDPLQSLGEGSENSSETFSLVVDDIEELKEHSVLPLNEDQKDKLIDSYDIDQPLLPKIVSTKKHQLPHKFYYISFFMLW